jgi:asparagine synthase (glutamine-hydrolysing)
MCGIAGILNFDGRSVLLEDLKKMTDSIAHRGPDGEGHWIGLNGNVGFGHRRLSIIDLSEDGKQPMSLTERYTITFNGEIYNYIELREELITLGYQFSSKSDTEVLLSLYAELGEAMLPKLDGMFSIAIWDEEKKQLLFKNFRGVRFRF